MDILEAVRTRKSVRGYKPDPVPKEVIEEILRIASRAPSGTNVQPWEITVITGQALDNIKRANIDLLNSGVDPNRDLADPPKEGKYRQRQVELAIQLFKLMGIAREDKEKRDKWMQRLRRFCDAPVAIILSMDKSLDEAPLMLLNIGAIMQTICLVALNHGLGTCIEGILFPQVIRKFTGIPESKRLIISIAMGYPDWDFPANKVETSREPLDNFVTWCGYGNNLVGSDSGSTSGVLG